MRSTMIRQLWGGVLAVAVALVAYWWWTQRAEGDALVVYCAHDAVFAEKLLNEFESRSGIDVVIRFDTEASKSLGLVNMLLRERQHPRCDVFWNNQLQGTLDLQDHGMLLPYRGAGYRRIPERFKDPGGHWTGFAGRLRVYIVNTDNVRSPEGAIQELSAADLSRMAVAKPLYGTTRSHYTALWNRWGKDKLIGWHRGMRSRHVREVAGNAMAKNLVASGKCDIGWTDSDDYYVAVDQQLPVTAIPIRLEGGDTICIPNSVAIIRGTSRLGDAKRLVDFLLSAETELALARCKSRQIPLGPVPEGALPAEVGQLKRWADDSCDMAQLGAARRQCLAWLKAEYLQ